MKTRIKELRMERNLSQTLLAQRLGTNQASLSKIERGISVPDASLIVDLSHVFHVSTDYILSLSRQRVTADILLSEKIPFLNKYQQYLSTVQKFDLCQQAALFRFLESMSRNSCQG